MRAPPMIVQTECEKGHPRIAMLACDVYRVDTEIVELAGPNSSVMPAANLKMNDT